TVTRLSKLPIAETVTLGPLDEREGTALLGERRPGTSRAEASRCWRGSGGNPLLMLALLGGAPGSPNGNHARLDDALARRFSGLSAEARQLAQEAAALGQGSFAWLAAVTTLDNIAVDRALTELHDADIVIVDGADQFSFAHPLLRETALTSVARPAHLFETVATRLEAFLAGK